MNTILIIDDEEDIRELLGEIFEDEGYAVLRAAHSEQALSLLSSHNIDLIVLDIWLDNSDMDGMQILKHLKSHEGTKEIPVLMISGHGNVEMAVNAMKIGAFDFIEKPFKIDHILLTVQRTLEQKILKDENLRLRGAEEITRINNQYRSPAMIAFMKSLSDHADSEARVLITGATGTGKTRMAKIIHGASKRGKKILRSVDASILTPERLENELINNAKGTLILEHVDRLNKQQQSEFLNILNTINISTRLICTASNDIESKVDHQHFSSALYDRIAVLHYEMPSLKERIEDIPLLIEELISGFRKTHGTTIRNDFMPVDYLSNLPWPGNIKQLKSAVEWMAYCQMGLNHNEHSSYAIPLKDYQGPSVVDYQQTTKENREKSDMESLFAMSLKEAREAFEFQYLSFMLEKFDGSIAKMANYVDMDRTALHRKLKSMNLNITHNKKA